MRSPHHRALVITTLALVIALSGGCKRGPSAPPAPHLVDVRVADRGDDSTGVDAQALTARAVEKLRAAAVMPVELGAEPRPGVDYRLQIEVEVSTEAAAEAADGANEPPATHRAVVAARLVKTKGGDTPPIVAQGVAERVARPGEDARAVRRAHVEKALDDVLRILTAQARVHVGDVKVLLDALGAPDADVRAEAVRVAAQRREKAAVPALCEMMAKANDADQRDLADMALGALVEIGDPAAVPAITKSARFRELGDLVKRIDAVAMLGGGEARAFLEFVAGSHESREMRQLAEEALGRMDRRAARRDAGQ